MVEKRLMSPKFGLLKFLSRKTFVPGFKSMGWLFQDSGARASPSRIGLNFGSDIKMTFKYWVYCKDFQKKLGARGT